MQIYFIYGILFITVVLLVESVFIFMRSRISGDQAANKRIRMIEKTGNEMVGLQLIKEARAQNASALLARFESLLWAAALPVSLPLVAAMGVSAGIALSLVLMVALAFPAPSAIGLGMVLGFGGVYLFVARRAHARRKLFEEQLIPSIDLVARGLQAGHPAAVALEIVAKEMPDPIGTEFGMAIDEMSYGLDRDTALQNICNRFPSAEMSFFTSALEIQRETGGNLVEVLNNLTTMMRDRRAMVKKVKAISSEGRITALVVGVLPFLMITILTFLSPGYFTESFDKPLFFPLMGLAFAFYIVGIVLIRRMINIRI